MTSSVPTTPREFVARMEWQYIQDYLWRLWSTAQHTDPYTWITLAINTLIALWLLRFIKNALAYENRNIPKLKVPGKQQHCTEVSDSCSAQNSRREVEARRGAGKHPIGADSDSAVGSGTGERHYPVLQPGNIGEVGNCSCRDTRSCQGKSPPG